MKLLLSQGVLDQVAGLAEDRDAPVTAVSVGVSTFEPTTGPSPEVNSLLNTAYAALFRAKGAGRNQVKVA